MKKIILALFLWAIPAFGTSYTFAPTKTENPVSEHSNWQNPIGGLWGNVQVQNNMLSGVSLPNQFGDPSAVLKGTWSANQSVAATVKITSVPSDIGEVELRGRTTITNNSITGYEVLCNVSSGQSYGMQFVRWNGPNGNFSIIASSTSFGVRCGNGDVLQLKFLSNTTAQVLRNGTVVTFNREDNGQNQTTLDLNFSDGNGSQVYTSGAPGVGFYKTVSTGFTNFGFSNFAATDGTIRTAATASQADVATAITSAAVNDVVMVPAGSGSWNSLALSKAVRLLGAGVGLTTITLGSGNTMTKQANGIISLQGFTMNKNGSGTDDKAWLVTGSWKNAFPIIVQNNTLNCTSCGMFRIEVAGGFIASTNTLTAGWDDSLFQIKDPADSSGSWTTVDSRGTNDNAAQIGSSLTGQSGIFNIYIEDNTITGGANQGVDCDDSCRMVFRDNLTTNFQANSHGFGTSAVGARQWEIYSNDMRNTCSRGTDCSQPSNQQHHILMRGGSGVVYSNKLDSLQTTEWGDKAEMQLAQDSNHDSSATNCVGVGSYPLNHQTGWGYNGTAQFVDPAYIYSNTMNNGGDFDLEVDFFYNCSGFNINNYVQSGREYFNTNGGANTPKPGYTALAYPNPNLSLTAAAPATLSVTTSSLPNGTVNVAYSTTLSATGGTPGYTWSLATGTLPAGLALASATGIISGTPTAAGTSNFTVRVTDSTSATATQALSITVSALPAVSMTSSINFGSSNVGIPTNTQVSTIQNTGGSTLNITSITASPSEFAITVNTCGSTLAAGNNCTVTMRLTPAAIGSRTGTLTMVDNASGSPHVTNLSGTGSVNRVVGHTVGGGRIVH